MTNQPLEPDSAKNKPFLRRPTTQTHRLEFSITASTSRNIYVRGHSATNSSNNDKVNNDNNNNRSLVRRRTGSALPFHPATTNTTPASRATISHSGPVPAPVRQFARIKEGVFNRPVSTDTKKPVSAALPEHHVPANVGVEQAQTPPKPRTTQLAQESHQTSAPLDNITATTPKISVPFFPVPNVPVLEIQQQQRTPLRTLSAFSPNLGRPVTIVSSTPELVPKLDSAKLNFAEHIVEPAGHRLQELNDMETVSDTSMEPDDCVMDGTANITHDYMPKQEKESAMPPPAASTSDMPREYRCENLSSSASRAVPSHTLQKGSVDFTDISVMLMDRTAIKQRWIEAERQRFRLVDELRMRLREESENYQRAWQEINAMNVSNNALQTRNSHLQTDVARLEAQVAESRARLQEIDTDRKKQADVHETFRSQMAARVDSFKQDSMKASIALKVLVTDKARWEADLATLRASMQDMECNRDLLRMSHDNLVASFSACSTQLKAIQADHDKIQEISQSQKEEIDQYRTRCQSLSDQLRQQSERVGELNREIEEGRIASEALLVTNSSMSDRNGFLEYASEYQQSIMTSQLHDVEERCREAYFKELNKVKDEFAKTKAQAVKEYVILESDIRESAMKTESLANRNLQLEAELSAAKEDSMRYMETITTLQEAKGKLEGENQRLIQSSMDAQVDYVIEVNNAKERFEELRQGESKENQATIQNKDVHIGKLSRQLEELTGEKQRLSKLVDYQAQTATATDHEMLELRVKIQLLQTDNDYLNKSRDDLKNELEVLQAQQAQQQQRPMPLTDIAKIHSRDRKGGSSSATDFLQWPVESGTPPTTGSLNLADASVSPGTVHEHARAPSSSVATRTGSARTTPTAAPATSPRSNRSNITTITMATTSPSSTAMPAAVAVVVPRTRSSNNSVAGKRTAAGVRTGGDGGGEPKRTLKRKRVGKGLEPRGIGDSGGMSEIDNQDDELDALGPSVSASGGVGTSANVKTRRQHTRRQAQQQEQSLPQTCSSSSFSNTNATTAAVTTKKSSRGK